VLSKEEINKLSVRAQTSEENIAREYVQNVFLSILGKSEGASRLLFKGGTALRLIYKSPRYSEDLDFTGIGISVKEIEDILQDIFIGMERSGFKIHLEDATVTTGGYLGKIFADYYTHRVLVKLEISFREKRKIEAETAFVENDYIPNYLVYHLPQKILVNEKINALLGRGKPRDYFDAYFILRNNLLATEEKKRLQVILDNMEKLKINFKDELGEFLPRSLHPIIKKFKLTLEQEIRRHIG
jgi:predicted nucleotidyltransferase component of viral defense system